MTDETYAIKYLDKDVKVTIERPMGSKHPEHNYYYPVNYGYVEATQAPDGEPIDAYILGVYKPLNEFTGVCIAVIHRIDDEDDKLIISLEGKHYSDDQIRALTEFQERFFKSEIIRN